MKDSSRDLWPIDEVVARLCAGDTLSQIVAARPTGRRRDVREHLFESLLSETMIAAFGVSAVMLRKQAQIALGLRNTPFPGSLLPDIMVKHNDIVHFCEAKSNRVDYARFDNVLEAGSMRKFLEEQGHTGLAPWEVEQDLIKLHTYPRIDRRVGSCLFLMIDAYRGPGQSWTKLFTDLQAFERMVRTKLVRSISPELIDSTTIIPLHGREVQANLIVSRIPSAAKLQR